MELEGVWFQVTWGDIIFRSLSVFTFSFLILKLNTDTWGAKNILTKIFLNIGVFIVWRIVFRGLDQILGLHTIINQRFDAFVYLLILLMLLVISYTMQLIDKSKTDIIENEKLKQKGLQNELAALKNQMNPHFLFNSLNSLSLLVRQDQESAERFIQKLSFLYRYILQSSEEELVPLNDEIKFLKSYIYLIKQRYQDNFEVELNISSEFDHQMIPSLSLQLLVENAVKHNEISKRNPLKVEIYSDEKYIIVRNKTQLRTGFVESTGVGLSNLSSRFRLLKQVNIEIENNAEYFVVKLQML
jgi:LytS/YehU family sensor histidine kinase